MTTPLAYKLGTSLGAPSLAACQLVRTSYDSPSCIKRIGASLGARALFVAQVIVSLIAIPLTFIAGLFATVYKLCTCKPAKEEFEATLFAPAYCLGTALKVAYFSILPFALAQKINEKCSSKRSDSAVVE